RKLCSIIDNTFASAMYFRPIERGFDLSLHSCTKYLNGHCDLVAGAVIGRAELIEAITHKLNHLGGCLHPEGCALLHPGIKQRAPRITARSTTALRIADPPPRPPAVAHVNSPGLPTHPRHARARELLDGFGGMLSFELHGGAEAAERFIARLTIPL